MSYCRLCCIVEFYVCMSVYDLNIVCLQMPVLCSCCLQLQAVGKFCKGAQIQRRSIFYNLESSTSGFPKRRILFKLHVHSILIMQINVSAF